MESGARPPETLFVVVPRPAPGGAVSPRPLAPLDEAVPVGLTPRRGGAGERRRGRRGRSSTSGRVWRSGCADPGLAERPGSPPGSAARVVAGRGASSPIATGSGGRPAGSHGLAPGPYQRRVTGTPSAPADLPPGPPGCRPTGAGAPIGRPPGGSGPKASTGPSAPSCEHSSSRPSSRTTRSGAEGRQPNERQRGGRFSASRPTPGRRAARTTQRCAAG